jgi:hypothetical protein
MPGIPVRTVVAAGAEIDPNHQGSPNAEHNNIAYDREDN